MSILLFFGFLKMFSAPLFAGEGFPVDIGNVKNYQIGSSWNRFIVDKESVSGKPPEYLRAAQAAVRFAGGSGFYLGKFNGHHLVATNYHVFSEEWACKYRKAQFTFLGELFPCEKVLGQWRSIDLTIFSIVVSDAEIEKKLAAVARNFDFNSRLVPGAELLLFGFGMFENQNRKLLSSSDSDCKIISGNDEILELSDPDHISPSGLKVWSFAMGCDTSHGDDGAAIIDRQTGKIIGMFWTTGTPKDSRVQDSEKLSRLQSDVIWSSLSYGVPARKIKDVIGDVLQNSHLSLSDDDSLETLQALLSGV